MTPPPLYHSYYCEENVWQLCQHPALAGHERWAVWVLAGAGNCPLWRQKAADDAEEPIFWDYHVLLVACESPGAACSVWDLDTTAGFPCALDDYLRLTFPYAGRLPRGFEPSFRVVPADDYVRLFSSDRSHMKDRRGRWLHSPPPWPPIVLGRPNTLARFRDLRDPIAGPILTLSELGQWTGLE